MQRPAAQLFLICLLCLFLAKLSYAQASASIIDFVLTDLGDGDMLVEPGESFLLNVTLANDGSIDLHNVNATLLATSSAILVTDNFQPYGPLPVGFTRDSPSFDFSIPVYFTDPNMFFVLTIQADEGTWVDIIEIPLINCSLSFTTDSSTVSWQSAFHNLSLVSSGDECTWVASSAQSWLTVLSDSGVGSAPFFYQVDSNASTLSRTGQIDINGLQHSVSQAGFSCEYTLEYEATVFDEIGGDDSLTIAAKYFCPWQAQTNDTWISLADSGINSGNGQVSFSVDFNGTYFDRSGFIFIAGDSICIKQRSVACLGVPLDSFDIHVNTSLNESPWDAIELSDGGYLITGQTENYGTSGEGDIFLSKFSCDDSLIWTQIYGTTGQDLGRIVFELEDGYLIAGGMTDTLNGDLNAALVFTDFNGNLLKTKIFGGLGADLITSGGETMAGDFVFAGYTSSTSGNEDGFVLKTQSNGNPIWNELIEQGKNERLYYGGEDQNGNLYFSGRTSTGPSDEQGFFTRLTPNGDETWTYTQPELGLVFSAGGFTGDGVLAVGRKRISSSIQHIFISKVDTTGNPIWQTTSGGTGIQFGTNITVLPDNDIMVCGRAQGDSSTETFAYLLKLNGVGDSLGSRLLSKQADDVARAVKPTSDGQLMLLSQSGGFAITEGDSWLRKVAPNIEDACAPPDHFNIVYETPKLDQSNSVIQLSTGGYLITGRTLSYDDLDNFDVMLVKTDCNGDTLWTRSYGGPGNDLGTEAVEVEDGYVVTGGINLGGSSFGLLVFKVDFDGELIWQKNYGDFAEKGNDIVQTADKGFLVAGKFFFASAPGVTKSNGWLLRLDQNGDSLWSYQNDDPKDDEFTIIIKTGDTLYLAGIRESTLNSSKSFVTALDLTSGYPSEIWYKFSPDSTAIVDCTALDQSFICVGRAKRDGSIEQTIVEKRFFHNGTLNFRRYIYDGYGRDFAKSLTRNRAGNVVFAGRNSNSESTPTYGWLYELDPINGSELSQQFYSLSGNDVFRKIITTRDSSLVVLGAWQGAPVFDSDTIKNWLLKIGDGSPSADCPRVTSLFADPSSNDVNLSWSTDLFYNGFQIQGGKIDGGFSIATSSSSFRFFPGLQPATTYHWQVRARCSDGSLSAFSVLDTFTTLNALDSLSSSLRMNSEQLITSNELSIWPNPATTSATISLPQLDTSDPELALLLLDQLGNVIRNYLPETTSFTVNLEGLTPGIYTVAYKTARSNYLAKLVVF